jgi:hypothetical protein
MGPWAGVYHLRFFFAIGKIAARKPRRDTEGETARAIRKAEVKVTNATTATTEATTNGPAKAGRYRRKRLLLNEVG